MKNTISVISIDGLKDIAKLVFATVVMRNSLSDLWLCHDIHGIAQSRTTKMYLAYVY
jgi:hypothetical protein